MRRITQMVTLLLVCSMTIFMACEGPQGPEGPQGQQGPDGPVGPAGEDGSMMYSGQGAPDTSIGENGDYYLDTDTGELYGPKDDDGWGNPIMVLKGEDGEDGSQIYSGSGVPAASLGALGDYYLDEDNYDLYGPKTENGWGSPINLKGADGNANVTRYIFPGNDFTSNSTIELTFSEVDSSAMRQSSWNMYLVDQTSLGIFYDHVPGITSLGDSYSVYHRWDTEMTFQIILEDGTGNDYEHIEVVRIEANSTEDQTSKRAGEAMIIPKDLDVSDYEAVADYYGFYNK